ncbi:hypothetical protein [Ideonella paludis]|uniref:Uncharacterized protein n=1 Tax=Ideonella paludis TaxID=1233411 RepID=A0ABS5DT71_9BURK|nr:hypothetical protein [Ideonella paludis]MBQ0934333.1 hypothetical protein [Ideonella paludis]
MNIKLVSLHHHGTMKHAGPASLQQLSPLLEEIRAIGGLREPKLGIFYRGASAFLHFHEDPSGLFADVKLDGKAFSRFSVDDLEAQAKLLELVARTLKDSGVCRRRSGQG